MPVNVNDKIRGLPAPQRRKVEARAAELMAEEMTLRELRKARKLTQVRLAKTLKINHDSVSRLEKRSDLLLDSAQSRRSHGRHPVLGRGVPRPPTGGAVSPRRRRVAAQDRRSKTRTCLMGWQRRLRSMLRPLHGQVGSPEVGVARRNPSADGYLCATRIRVATVTAFVTVGSSSVDKQFPFNRAFAGAVWILTKSPWLARTQIAEREVLNQGLFGHDYRYLQNVLEFKRYFICQLVVRDEKPTRSEHCRHIGPGKGLLERSVVKKYVCTDHQIIGTV